MYSVKLAPSILASDFTRLGDEVAQACEAGADLIHVDVMDGRFVPNISIGLPIVAALRPLADQYAVPLDVHLMIVEPEKYLQAFAEAGADALHVHVETCPHLHRTLQQIQELGLKAGVAINPGTPLVMLEEALPLVDAVLVMTVNPGFGGQAYIPGSTDKIKRLRNMLLAIRSPAEVQIDGGVTAENTAEIVRAGASILVAGSAIFGGRRTIEENVQALRHAVASAGTFSV